MKKNSSDYKIRRADAISAPSPTGFRRNPYFNAYAGEGLPPLNPNTANTGGLQWGLTPGVRPMTSVGC